MSNAGPTVLALYRNVIGATLHPVLKGLAGRLRHANRQSAVNSQSQLEVFADFFFIRCASPSGRVKIAAPIVLAPLKGNKIIDLAWISIRRALPIVIQIACLFYCTDRKRNFIQCETTAN
jgi:hypothetical protein